VAPTDPVEELWRAGRAAWPDVEIPKDAFAAHLDGRGPVGDHATDLYLACGCALGLPAAIAAFDRGFVVGVARHLRTLNLTAAQLEDLRQLLREKLLVKRSDRPSPIADYSGRGSLVGWFRVLAVREAIDLVSHREERRPIVERPPERAAPGDPTDEMLKARYRAQFNAALREAIDTLDGEQRNLLRLHYLDGLSLEELAAFFGVHRATVARRMAEARTAVSDGMSARLRAALGVGAADLESLLKILGSQLEVSISAAFAEGAA
jgi:RNA polymerase sigma-70 factor (ECF subfamily)